jgi:predicted TPR repeat methyltransferase
MMGAAAFDDRYAREGDPWGYRSSAYERAKYDATLAACGDGPFRSALELGASIGVFSAMLAPRCEALVTVDVSEVAVTEARSILAGLGHVTPRVAEIPWELENGDHDLIVASEVLYYLDPVALSATLTWLKRGLADRGRLIIVHWRPEGPERPFSAREVHDRVLAEPWLAVVDDASTEDYLLHVLERA